MGIDQDVGIEGYHPVFMTHIPVFSNTVAIARFRCRHHCRVTGRRKRYGHFATCGIKDRLEFTLPPVFSHREIAPHQRRVDADGGAADVPVNANAACFI